MTNIILASKSEARKKVLEDLGLKFKVFPAEIDERTVTASSPFELVLKLARMKAEYVVSSMQKNSHTTCYQLHTTIIIAADSLAIIKVKQIKNKNLQVKLTKYRLGNYYLLGKPKTKPEAYTFLTTLSDNIHFFITGICICDVKAKLIHKSVTKTLMEFRKLTFEEINNYIENQPVLSWAGGYQIEKGTPGENFVRELKGSFTNVLGLPKERILKLL